MGKIVIFLATSIGYCYSLLPRKIQISLGNLIGVLLYGIRFRFQIVEQNIKLAYPNQSEMQKQMVWRSYRSLGNLILEVFMVLGPLKHFVLKYVDVSGLQYIESAKKKGKGLIFLSSHLGNWEVMAAAGGLIAKTDLMLVTKRLKPEWLHQAIEAGRRKCGVSAAYEPKTLRQVLAHLKNNGTVGFVLDQYAGPPVGVRVPVFGVPVGTSLAVAALVKRTEAELLPVENYRTPDGRWKVIVHPPLEWIRSEENQDSHLELAKNTSNYANVLEKMIRAHPEQWLWTHRRFKGDLEPLRKDEWNEPRVRK